MTLSGNGSISGNVRMIAGALVAPVKATVTSPTNASTHQTTAPTFTWTNGGGATGFNVYLDKSATHNPPTTKVVDNQNVLYYTPAALDVNTEYVLRVDAVNGSGTTTGDVVTFTTLNPVVVTTITRFEVGSNGDLITPTLLGDGTTGAGTWTITPDPAVDLTISTDVAFTAIGFKLSDGSGYSTTAATKSLKCANTDDVQRAICTLGQHSKVSLFFALRLGSGFGSTAYDMDFGQMVSGTGISPAGGETNDFSAFNWKDSTRRLKAHTLAGKDTGIYVPSNLRWYGVTVLWDPASALTTVKVYDTTTKPWALVDTSTLALKSFNLHSLQFGHIDATGGFINSPHYFGILAWDTTGATYPLLPDEAYGS